MFGYLVRGGRYVLAGRWCWCHLDLDGVVKYRL